MKVKFKKLNENAVLPSYAKLGDAGLDLTAIDNGIAIFSEDSSNLWYYVEYKTGLSVEILEGYVGLLFPRSSISKSALILANSVGVIDSGYRGEVCLRFKIDAGVLHQVEDLSKQISSPESTEIHPARYKKGDRIGQLMIIPYPTIEPEFVEDLSATERGESGFGSTNTAEEVKT